MKASNLFSTHLKKSLLKAIEFAEEFGHELVTLQHLLYGLSAEKGSLSSELLTKAEFPVDLLKQELIRAFHQPYAAKQKKAELHDDVIDVLTKSVRTAQLYDHTYVGTEHALACLLHLSDQKLRDLFRIWHINTTELQRQLLVVLKSTSKFPDLAATLQELQQQQDGIEENEPEFPVLESLGKELTTQEAIRTSAPLIGREAELLRLQQIISRRYKNTPLLVGHPGVGKTAIVEGLARQIVEGTAPHSLKNKRIFALELSSLVAGTMYRGEFEQRLKLLIDECKSDPSLILFIDEFHTIVGAGSSGQSLDAANILKPALARGEIRCIGATTFKEYKKHLKTDGALNRRLEMIRVHPPSKEETKIVLEGIKPHLESFHHVKYKPDAILAALELSERYLPHRHWPDKAIDLLDESAASKTILRKEPKAKEKERSLKKQLKDLQSKKQEALGQDCYQEALGHHSAITGVLEQLKAIASPKVKRDSISAEQVQAMIETKLAIDLTKQRSFNTFGDYLSSMLQQELVGQDEAISTLSTYLQHSQSPLKDAEKPLGAFLLVGPSGVGKTFTAKLLAKSIFGSEQHVIRLDMSEYSEKHTISKLLGAPAGYVGHQQSSVLADALEEYPQAIILFDEVEKAHPDIFHLLLQVLDVGKLKDSAGNELDFTQSLIVMTSNLGGQELGSQVGFEQISTEQRERERRQIVERSIRDFFRPELLNRLDAIVHYQPLGISQRQAIIKKKLQALNERLDSLARLDISDDLILTIAEQEYKEQQGIRSLEQFFKTSIEFPLSQRLSSTSFFAATLKKTNNGFSLEAVE